MAGFPQYLISEADFFDATEKMSQLDLVVECVKEKYFITENDAYYREWLVEKNDIKVIMWDEHPRERVDDKVVVSVGTPSGKKGINLLATVQASLLAQGAVERNK